MRNKKSNFSEITGKINIVRKRVDAESVLLDIEIRGDARRVERWARRTFNELTTAIEDKLDEWERRNG